jgi:hypothetical protein
MLDCSIQDTDLDTARNNLRSMKKGDLAFFYHSNCKVPAIVGIMEIVKEHSPDRNRTFLTIALEMPANNTISIRSKPESCIL